MKNVMITGENSYIGTNISNWLGKFTDQYNVKVENIKDVDINTIDFINVDVVIHVAGIAHLKETKQNAHLYDEVNHILAVNLAKIAKANKVKQFIFMSSMSVYGNVEGMIDKTTVTVPNSYYGKSKLDAEVGIQSLETSDFRVAILRPPMVYGYLCKGNYQRLSGLAKKTKLFPLYTNKRSMIYIDFLCEFIRLLIDASGQGIFCPQNSSYVNTTDMVINIGDVNNHKVATTRLFNGMIKLLSSRVGVVSKVFGDLYYSQEMSNHYSGYNTMSFKDTIIQSELGDRDE